MAENTAGTAHAPERQRLRPERGQCGARPCVLSGPGRVAASRVALPCPPSPSASCPKRSRVLSSAPGGCRDFLVPREAGNRAGTRPPWPLTGCFSGVLGPCPAFRCERPELMTRLLSPEERRGHGSEQTVACWFKVWISRWTWRSTRPCRFLPALQGLGERGRGLAGAVCVWRARLVVTMMSRRSHVRSARWSQRGRVARCPGDSPKPRTRSAASTPRSARCSRPLVPSPRGRRPRSDHGEAGARSGGRDRPPCGEADGESCSLRVP